MANGTIQSDHYENLSDQITTYASLASNDVWLVRVGPIAIFKFRMKPSSSFPVANTHTHTIPIHPPTDMANYQAMVPKTNASGSVLVEVRMTGEVYVYSYSAAYSDWVTGEIVFPVG